MVRVLLITPLPADNGESPLAEILQRALESDSEIQVVGRAAGLARVTGLARELEPELILAYTDPLESADLEAIYDLAQGGRVPLLVVGPPTQSSLVVAHVLEAGAADVIALPVVLLAGSTERTDERAREINRIICPKIHEVFRRRLPSVSGGGGVILLVDDSPLEQSVIRGTLARDPYEIHVASDGHMAVEKAKALRPDLIILDYLLPEVDGLSVLKDIRAMGLDAVVIMLTGHGSEQVAAAALLYRADYYLIKPVVPWQLRDLVQVSLRYRKTAHDLHHLTELHLKVLDSLPVGVFILDRQGHVRGWNRAMERLTDIPENRVLGRSAFESCPFLIQIQNSGMIARLLETGETQVIEEMPTLNVRGRAITLAIRLALLHSGEAIVGVLEDITPRVEGREQLLQAERMAVATKMVVTTSHEINNPLTVILGNIQFLKEDLGFPLNEQSQEDISLIEQSALRVQEFIRRMANISSATTAPYVGGLEMFDLGPMPKTTE